MNESATTPFAAQSEAFVLPVPQPVGPRRRARKTWIRRHFPGHPEEWRYHIPRAYRGSLAILLPAVVRRPFAQVAVLAVPQTTHSADYLVPSGREEFVLSLKRGRAVSFRRGPADEAAPLADLSRAPTVADVWRRSKPLAVPSGAVRRRFPAAAAAVFSVVAVSTAFLLASVHAADASDSAAPPLPPKTMPAPNPLPAVSAALRDLDPALTLYAASLSTDSWTLQLAGRGEDRLKSVARIVAALPETVRHDIRTTGTALDITFAWSAPERDRAVDSSPSRSHPVQTPPAFVSHDSPFDWSITWARSDTSERCECTTTVAGDDVSLLLEHAAGAEGVSAIDIRSVDGAYRFSVACTASAGRLPDAETAAAAKHLGALLGTPTVRTAAAPQAGIGSPPPFEVAPSIDVHAPEPGFVLLSGGRRLNWVRSAGRLILTAGTAE